MLNARIGADVTHVPYRGAAPAANDLIGGQIDYLCGNMSGAVPLALMPGLADRYINEAKS